MIATLVHLGAFFMIEVSGIVIATWFGPSILGYMTVVAALVAMIAVLRHANLPGRRGI